MMLLTKANRKALKPLYATDGDTDARYVVKFFTPDGSATWWASEFDGEDLFFGYADLGLGPGCAELGYFRLSDLQSVRGKTGLRIERDRCYTPQTLDEIQN